MKELPEQLRELIEKKGLRKDFLAEKFGVCNATISRCFKPEISFPYIKKLRKEIIKFLLKNG